MTYNSNCRMFGCEAANKCLYPDNCGPDGFVTLGRIRYAGPWCCEDGETLHVSVCPNCADVSSAYAQAASPDPVNPETPLINDHD